MIQPYSVQAFLPFKGPGGVFTEPPPQKKISGTIEGSPMKHCTLIALLKVYQNTQSNS